MASALNEESVEKKLQNVTNAQDSIQTLSLWIIHHKAHHKKIVRLWFKVLRKAKIPQRLTLFYLCNDVVQHGRKKATVYLESFQGILKLAVEYVRDASIRQSILRLLKIWEERSVFKGPFIEELRSSVSSDKDLSAEKPKPAEEPAKPKVQVDQKILAEFKPQKVFDKMSSFKRFEAEVELRSRQLAHLRLDASSIEAVKQLKDRAHGNEFRKQFEDSCVKLNEFVGSFEKEVSDRKALIASLEQGELFYQAQFGEAKIVTNAYKIFGTKLNNLKKKLDELKKTLPEPLSPLPSPSVDAPSPMSTPTYEPDTQAVDMEMSDEETAATRTQDKPAESMEEESTPKKPLVSFTISKTPTKPAVAVKPAVSDNLDARIATMLPALGQNKDQPSGSRDSTQWNGNTSKKSEDLNATASSIPSQFKALSVNNDTPEDGGGTPLKDEGSSTPVQDEAPEPQPSNPIEFLTKLISQTKKTNPQSSHFLQNLGILATTMKNKSEKPKPLNHDSSSSEDVSSPGKTQPPQSWSAWKAKQTHDKSPVNGQEGDVSPTYSAQPQPPVSVPSQLPGPVPPPISPSGMVGGYGASAMPVPVPDPQQLTPPVMPPVGPPSPNIPSMPDISIPPPWLPLSQPPRPPHISQPTSPIGVPPPVNAGPINLGLGPINLLSGPRPVNMGPGHINTGSEFNAVPDLHSDFITATGMEDVPQQDESPSWSGPVIDLYSPPPAINTKPSPAPKGILRNRNSALKEVKLVPLSDTEDQSMLISAISTVAGGRSRSSSGSSQPTSPITGPKPPPHPPGNLLPSGRRTSNSEDRLEFIEKLKRKTSQASGDADTSQQLPKPQVFCKDPGRPNLTTIVLTGDSDNGASAGADVADEEESTMEEEEPVGAPISTIDRAQAPRTINPIVDLGRPDSRQPPRFDDIRHSGNLPRNYEYHERREGFRERRDRFQDRRLPPHDRYVDPYRDPYYYPRPDPYGHPPPPKRPFPDPYYDRGRPPYHPHRY